ncbi:Mitochondrial adenine nucleotide transporter ADNT1 [Geodia barretti]|uniref:Mitochondrial adenine nucleotide transporter ADNT1 n=1 Tax=Geodia barretti TaxID=519541 RepID=A0AA35VY91_GEOBA|nr:Mitochondrial adenine nucleotide transporter ADNT1 [Geodia barretti]
MAAPAPANATIQEEEDEGLRRPSSLWDRVTLSQLKHLVAGGVAGAVSRTAVSPLERMKILFQLQVETVKGERKFQGMASTLRLIWREEGVKGYFKGNGTNVMRIVPYVAVQFAAYEEYKKLLGIPDDVREQSPLKRLVAGGLAGITSVTATYPLDLVRTRLSAQGEGPDRKYKNVRHAFRTILKEEGGMWSGCLYRGIFPTLCGIAPYVGLNFAVYETLKGWVMLQLLEDDDNRQQVELDSELPVGWKLGCGAIAGALGQSGECHMTTSDCHVILT